MINDETWKAGKNFRAACTSAISKQPFEKNVLKRCRRNHDLAVKIFEKFREALPDMCVHSRVKHGNEDTLEKHDKPHGSSHQMFLAYGREHIFTTFKPGRRQP